MFKPILENPEEIASYIVEFAVNYIDKEFVMEYFWGCKAILKTVSIETLQEDEPTQNIRSLNIEKQYKKLPIETMPPLIVKNSKVLDGNHRLRVTKTLGLKEIVIYDVIDI